MPRHQPPNVGTARTGVLRDHHGPSDTVMIEPGSGLRSRGLAYVGPSDANQVMAPVMRRWGHAQDPPASSSSRAVHAAPAGGHPHVAPLRQRIEEAPASGWASGDAATWGTTDGQWAPSPLAQPARIVVAPPPAPVERAAGYIDYSHGLLPQQFQYLPERWLTLMRATTTQPARPRARGERAPPAPALSPDQVVAPWGGTHTIYEAGTPFMPQYRQVIPNVAAIPTGVQRDPPFPCLALVRGLRPSHVVVYDRGILEGGERRLQRVPHSKGNYSVPYLFDQSVWSQRVTSSDIYSRALDREIQTHSLRVRDMLRELVWIPSLGRAPTQRSFVRRWVEITEQLRGEQRTLRMRNMQLPVWLPHLEPFNDVPWERCLVPLHRDVHVLYQRLTTVGRAVDETTREAVRQSFVDVFGLVNRYNEMVEELRPHWAHLVAAQVQPLRFVPAAPYLWVFVIHLLSVGFMTGSRACIYEEYTRYSMAHGDLRGHQPLLVLPAVLLPDDVPEGYLPEGLATPLPRRVFPDAPIPRSVVQGQTFVSEDDLFGLNVVLDLPVPQVMASPPNSDRDDEDFDEDYMIGAQLHTGPQPHAASPDLNEIGGLNDDPMGDA